MFQAFSSDKRAYALSQQADTLLLSVAALAVDSCLSQTRKAFAVAHIITNRTYLDVESPPTQ